MVWSTGISYSPEGVLFGDHKVDYSILLFRIWEVFLDLFVLIETIEYFNLCCSHKSINLCSFKKLFLYLPSTSLIVLLLVLALASPINMHSRFFIIYIVYWTVHRIRLSLFVVALWLGGYCMSSDVDVSFNFFSSILFQFVKSANYFFLRIIDTSLETLLRLGTPLDICTKSSIFSAPFLFFLLWWVPQCLYLILTVFHDVIWSLLLVPEDSMKIIFLFRCLSRLSINPFCFQS